MTCAAQPTASCVVLLVDPPDCNDAVLMLHIMQSSFLSPLTEVQHLSTCVQLLSVSFSIPHSVVSFPSSALSKV